MSGFPAFSILRTEEEEEEEEGWIGGGDTPHTKPRKNVISGALDPFPSSHRSIWIERGGAENRKEKEHISQEGKNR